MWRALLTEGFPNLPATMSFDSVAMSCLVTSMAGFLPRPGRRKRSRWLAVFSQLSSRGRISPSGFLTGVFIHSIRSSMISATVLRRFAFAVFCRGKSRRAPRRPCLEAVDLAAGVLDGEGLRVVGTEPAGALLTGLPVGKLEREGRHPGRGDADVQSRAFAVVELGPLGDPFLAQAVGQNDAAIAAPLAGGGEDNGSIHVVSAPKAWDQRARLWGFQFVVRTLKGSGPGPYFGEAC